MALPNLLPHPFIRSLACLCLAGVLFPSLLCADEPPAAAAADAQKHFLTHVEPLLHENCYGCHSHTAAVMEGGLTLDWRSGWEQGGGRGPAVIPGNPDASLLIQAVRHQHAELHMPEEKLEPATIAILEEWVRSGAADPRATPPEPRPIDADWWSLRPLKRPAIPPLPTATGTPATSTPGASTAPNPVDAFLWSAWQRAGLQPTPAADRRTLIRRLTVELHGLLPTPDDTAAFISDPDPRALEKLVDRLLDSPHYGERWARHWMDIIHFADSHGYEHDVFRPHAWRYRDYLIASFNADIPWGQFIREQLAADVYAASQPPRQAALGFLGAGTYDHSAASTAPRNFENLDRDDMVTQTLTAFCSTTAGCARCHDHKFDPVTQADYYSLQAVFAGIGKGDIPFDADPAVSASRLRWQELRAAADRRDPTILLTPETQTLISSVLPPPGSGPLWMPIALHTFQSLEGAQLKRLDDDSLLATGPRPDTDTTTLIFSPGPLKQVTAVRLDVLPHESFPAQGPGRAENGNLHLNEVELKVFSGDQNEGQSVAFQHATADFEQDGWTIAHAIDGNPQSAWGIHPHEGKAHAAVFELKAPIRVSSDTTFHLVLRQSHGRGHTIGRLRVSLTNAPPQTAHAYPADLQALLDLPADGRSPEQQLQLAAHALKRRADVELSQLPPAEKLYAAAPVATNERGTIRFDTPREIRILKRGDVDQPTDVALPGALTILESAAGLPARFSIPDAQPEAARRAALAEWIAAPDNPLTWRSAANRIWQYHFGRGLCETSGDFGRMGSLPDHPELLDWLACELRDHGSLKRLHRILCLSAAWQASAEASEQALQTDPRNQLVARRSRQRLDADSWRDSVLLASGRLDDTMGGPAIAHFSSRPGAQLTPILDYSTVNWDAPGMTRRSIYRVVWRGIPDPLLEQLDFPDLGLPAPVRGQSVSPLQALTLLNNRFVLHHAEHLAQRALRTGPDVETQVTSAVSYTWQRLPAPAELDVLSRLARDHGLSAVARLLLNSAEFLILD
ncbi:MAG: PSD1 and planctomycete cytochrome C domain-containing protein [Planctomycetota bacterium]